MAEGIVISCPAGTLHTQPTGTQIWTICTQFVPVCTLCTG